MTTTTLPWSLERGANGALCIISESGCIAVLENNPYQEGIDDRTNGERIVRAVIAHDDLLAACRAVCEAFDWHLPAPGTRSRRYFSACAAAIAKAGGR